MDQQLDDALFQAIRLREVIPNELTFDLPKELASVCAGEEVQASIARVSQLAAFLGASLAPLPVEVAVSTTVLREPARPAPSATPAATVSEDASVLIIANGKRAREVVRHLKSGGEREPDLAKPEW